MRNVVRPTNKPYSLAQNEVKWKKSLLTAIKKAKKNGKKCSDYNYNHYNQQDIKSMLLKLYKGYCCYCESRVDTLIDESEDDGMRRYGHIEHLKPKKKFPNLCFAWDNLHVACADCNTSKGDKYNNRNPILDPTKDNQISTHYKFEVEGLGVWFVPLDKRAKTTETHADLNRGSLRQNRLEVYLNMINIFKEWNKIKNIQQKKAKIKQLKTLSKEDQYGSVIAWVLNEFFQ